MTTSPAAPICPVATISGERPAALVSPATDLIGGGHESQPGGRLIASDTDVCFLWSGGSGICCTAE